MQKSCLEKNFILNKDYKNSICNLAKQQNFATAATVAKTTEVVVVILKNFI